MSSSAAYNRAYYVAHREGTAVYRAAHLEETNASARAYRVAHLEATNASARKYRVSHREEKAAYLLKRKHDMTLAERAAMFEQQGGLCAIPGCGSPATHLDHCHNCEDIDRRGSVRGLLCQPCNVALDHIARFSPVHAAYLAPHAAVCPVPAVALASRAPQ